MPIGAGRVVSLRSTRHHPVLASQEMLEVMIVAFTLVLLACGIVGALLLDRPPGSTGGLLNVVPALLGPLGLMLALARHA